MSHYVRDALVAELLRDEGKRLTPYRDSLGYWTVGVGHLLVGNQLMQYVDVPTGIVRRKLTEAQCQAWLDDDIDAAELNLTRIFPAWTTLDPVRQRALLNLSFNLGGKLAQFKGFFSHVARHEWADAANHLEIAPWFRQVRSRGPRIVHAIRTGTPWSGA